MIKVGPYRFSENDARRLLQHAELLLDLAAEGRDASVLEPLRAKVRTSLTTPGSADSSPDSLAEVWSALLEAGPLLRAAGQLPAQATGTVRQVSRSGGGVPKAPVDSLAIGYSGAEGDVQANRKHHGSPFQALCIWSAEVIDELHREGHPIHAGAAGENVTVDGLPWADVRPGVRLALGEVICDVSSYAIPCAKNAVWFSDRDFQRIHHDQGPRSRVYATVIRPGTIRSGDAAVLEP